MFYLIRVKTQNVPNKLRRNFFFTLIFVDKLKNFALKVKKNGFGEILTVFQFRADQKQFLVRCQFTKTLVLNYATMFSELNLVLFEV